VITHSPRWKHALAGSVAAAMFLAACGGGSDSDTASDGTASGGGDATGTVLVDGSSTVGPLAEVAAELFMEANPKAQVTVAQSGTSGGFEKFCVGETDMNNASREIKESEVAKCEENSIGQDGVQVANDALALIVNPDNPLACITVDQAKQIWDQGSTVSTWGAVTGLDIPSSFASEKLTLYGPGADSGTFDFFTDAINGKEGQIRTDYTSIGEDDQQAIVAVEGDKGAMAYVPYSFFQEAGDKVKPLEIDGGSGCVEATLDNVQSGKYTPLGRPLFSYASDAALKKPQVVSFVTFWVENSEEISKAAGFVPMTDAQIAASKKKVEALSS
jgi:phosphate transport system substrate-binding protein